MTAGGIRDRIESWDGEGVFISHEPRTDSWIFVALHDTRLGPAVGGTRMKSYPDLSDAVEDAMRLARGMTYKWAGVGIPYGGGKAVIATPEPIDGPDRTHLLSFYARRVASLRGGFRTGEDLGTTPSDMEVIAAAADVVMGMEGAHCADPGPYTALGVFSGMKAALEQRFGDPSFEDRTVLIQGVGDVGLPLAELLHQAGASLIFCDLHPDRARQAADRFGGTTVTLDALFDTTVDIYAPCAVGATLDADSIPRLQCEIVAGSANNQLATEPDADRLHARDVLYAPDYIVNAGGAIAFGRMDGGQRDDAMLRREVAGIESTLGEIFVEARDADESPLYAARRRAERFMDEAAPRDI